MENLKRRGLSLLLALVMIVSLFAGIQLPKASAATVYYVKDGNYVYNWGTRGEKADYLSPMAEVWWGNQTAYSTLAAMDGSSNLDTVSTSALYTKLAEIMADAHTTMTTYDDTRYLYQYTDCQKSNTSKLTLLYLGEEVSSTWDGGTTFNREHTWPNSLSNSGSNNSPKGREADIMILYAADPTENSTRNNHPYGEGSGYYDPLYGYNGDDGTNTKRSLNVRGDVARAILYSYVRYGTDATYNDGALNYMWAEDGGVFQNLDTLLSWMESDPVDTWEMGRNDAVESITGTRNVFVDYPELAFLLFDERVPSGYTTPSGGKDVVSESYTVTIKENGVTTNTFSGNSVTLPQSTKTIDGYKFEGWVEAEVDKAESKPTVYAAGASYLPSKDTTLYALYSYSETTSGGESTSSTEYIFNLGTDDSSKSHSESSSDKATYTENVKVGNTTYTLNITDASKFYANSYDVDGSSVVKLGSSKAVGSFTISNIPDAVTKVIINITGRQTEVAQLDVDGTTYDINTSSNNDEYTAVEIDTSTDKTLNISTVKTYSTDYRAYMDSIVFVAGSSSAGSSTTYYTTATCKHTNTSTVTTPASCTEAGSTTVTCKDCGTVISETIIPATDHNYVNGICTGCGNPEPAESIQVVIYAPKYLMALSSTYSTENTNYNAGVEVTVSGSSVTGYDSTEVWTLTDNGDGTYSLMYNDQYLGINTNYNSMSLFAAEDAVNHKWEIIPVGENLYNIRNTTKANDNDETGYCIEWCSDSYTTYNPNTPYSEKAYQLSFYVVSGTLPTFTCDHAYVVTSTPGPSCTAYDEVKLCSKCGDKQTAEIPATTEHNMVAGTVVPPTATDYGYTLYHCDICGSYTEERDKVDPITGTEGITVTFVVPAGVAPISPMVTTDEGIELPTPGIPSADYEYSFVGWAKETVNNSATAPTLYNGNFAPSESVTLYAVYTYGTAGTDFTLVEDVDDLVIGNEIVIVATEYDVAMGAQGSNNRGQVTITKDGKTVSIVDDVQVFTLAQGTVANTYAFNTGSGYLHAASNSSNYLRTQANIDGNASWTISISDGVATVKAQGNYTRNWMQYNLNSKLFAAYSSAQKNISLYTKGATQLTYTTEITRTEAYTVTFSTPSGVAAIPSTVCGKTGIILPTAGTPYNEYGYAFMGWTTTALDKETTKPTIYTAGSPYYATDDITFYAVYSYSTEGDGSVIYKLATDVSDLADGKNIVIVAADYDYALSTTQNNNNRGQASIEKDTANNTVTFGSDVQILTLGAVTDAANTYTLSTGSGYLYAAGANSNNYLKTNATVQTNGNSNFLFTFSGDTCTIVAQGSANRNNLQYNSNSSIFSCYSSEQKAVSVYVETPSGATTYYTTAPIVATPPELKFHGASLEVGEGISINYKVAASLFAKNLYDLDSAFATFVFNEGTEDKRTFTVSNPVLSGDYYVFQLKNIRPDWMGDVVIATLTAEDATGASITSEPIDYSVAKYCYNKLENETAENSFSTLLVDMLNYGAATQLHTGYKTNALVNADLTDAQKAWGSDATDTLENVQSFTGNAGSVSWKGAALFLRETVRIRLRFAAEDVTGLKVVATVGGNSYELTDFTDAGNGQYYVFFDNLLATQMRAPITFTVMNGNSSVSKTLTYSVASYAAAVSESNTTLYNMIHAMMRYGDAVNAYAG